MIYKLWKYVLVDVQSQVNVLELKKRKEYDSMGLIIRKAGVYNN